MPEDDKSLSTTPSQDEAVKEAKALARLFLFLRARYKVVSLLAAFLLAGFQAQSGVNQLSSRLSELEKRTATIEQKLDLIGKQIGVASDGPHAPPLAKGIDP